MRFHRRARGMTHKALAAVVGLTYQQPQKYEYGTNRIAASRLYHISRVLDVPFERFLA
jgi:transcriptional regulator with XRE-family HTH domain